MSSNFIQIVETPNPQTLKFLMEIEVMPEGTLVLNKDDDTKVAPIAKDLFSIDGVESLFFGRDFISITKNSESDWQIIKTFAVAAIMDFRTSGMPLINHKKIASNNQNSEIDGDEISKQIQELINEKIRPAVAQDGGDIIFREFKNGVVYVELQGACSGCPSSTITLKSGIENMLKYYVPEVDSVEEIANS